MSYNIQVVVRHDSASMAAGGLPPREFKTFKCYNPDSHTYLRWIDRDLFRVKGICIDPGIFYNVEVEWCCRAEFVEQYTITTPNDNSIPTA